MVSKGARNLVLLSRRDINSPNNSELAAFVRRLQGSGATVYCPKCDVSDAESLGAVLAYCKANLPPIKGCIQAAMELRVGFLSVSLFFLTFFFAMKTSLTGLI